MELISKDTAIRVVDSGRNRQQLVDMMRAVPPVNAIEIPDGATNGDVIMAIYPSGEYQQTSRYNIVFDGVIYEVEWWNAPYKNGGLKC